VACLDQSRGASMGEGWSDFFALSLLAEPGDADVDPQPIGAYLVSDPGGIRTHPYSTDFAINDLTFQDVQTQSVPHGVGEVWAVSLWEMYWNLVRLYGFDASVAPSAAGNTRAIALVVDALSIQACDPSFLEARDALLQADLASTGGADACPIWDAFARRGMGAGATDTGSGAISVSEDFGVPPSCDAWCGDGVTQAPETCDDANRIDFDGCHSGCQGEDEFTLSGTAQGGHVSLTIDGVVVDVTTSPGQTAEQVIAALAAAIESDPTLSAQGISAQANGNVLTTGGTIESSDVADAGFAPPVPGVSTLAPAAQAALLLLLAAFAALALSARRARRRAS
jgi:cysteine-rich repeat protein